MPLRSDFLWGGALSANQCEGAWDEGGRVNNFSRLVVAIIN